MISYKNEKKSSHSLASLVTATFFMNLPWLIKELMFFDVGNFTSVERRIATCSSVSSAASDDTLFLSFFEGFVLAIDPLFNLEKKTVRKNRKLEHKKITPRKCSYAQPEALQVQSVPQQMSSLMMTLSKPSPCSLPQLNP
jgi:hypothetical protein